MAGDQRRGCFPCRVPQSDSRISEERQVAPILAGVEGHNAGLESPVGHHSMVYWPREYRTGFANAGRCCSSGGKDDDRRPPLGAERVIRKRTTPVELLIRECEHRQIYDV